MFFCDYPILRSEQKLPLFLVNLGLHKCQDHITRTEGYPYPQILYCTKGSGELIVKNKKYIIPPFTAVYLPPDCPHEYYPTDDVWDIHWVVASGYDWEDVFSHFGFNQAKVFELGEVKILEHIFRKMHDAIRSDSVFGNYRASGYLYDFLIELFRITSTQGATGATNSALMKAVDYINYNFSSQITLNKLCEVSGVSRQYLCLLFRENLGTRPMEYIAKRRIQTAKELLTAGNKSIEEIAEETGFCQSSYFCKLFKRYEGITPSQFRNARY